MKIRRFIAPDVKQAIEQVREQLGPDAVILSNRRVDDGVEVISAIDYDETEIFKPQIAPASAETSVATASPDISAALSAVQAKRNAMHKSAPKPPAFLLNETANKLTQSVTEAANETPVEPKQEVQQLEVEANASAQAELTQVESSTSQEETVNIADNVSEASAVSNIFSVASEPAPVQDYNELSALRKEVFAMRGLLENELAGLAWSDKQRRDPNQIEVLQRFANLGLSPSLAKDIVSEVITASGSIETVWQDALSALRNRLIVTGDDVLDTGGVVALVGTTGVGKTTTLAKIAARYALKFGPEQVALVSTDCYRIAAQEQLRTYAKIIGVSLRMAEDVNSLLTCLNRLRDKKLVLIDTAGLSQRDKRLLEQKQMLSAAGRHIKIFLVLSGTCQSNAVAEGISAFGKEQLAGTILTKLDECTGLGEVLSSVIQAKLPIAYVTDGQRVPEDLHFACQQDLIQMALEISKEYKYDNNEESLATAFAGG